MNWTFTTQPGLPTHPRQTSLICFLAELLSYSPQERQSPGASTAMRYTDTVSFLPSLGDYNERGSEMTKHLDNICSCYKWPIMKCQLTAWGQAAERMPNWTHCPSNLLQDLSKMAMTSPSSWVPRCKSWSTQPQSLSLFSSLTHRINPTCLWKDLPDPSSLFQSHFPLLGSSSILLGVF